jgi:hypothetical protein
MSEQPQLIYIDETPYLIDDLGDTCKEKLGSSQQAKQAIGMFAALIQSAQKGADLDFKEGVALLPDPYQPEEAAEETEVVDNRH